MDGLLNPILKPVDASHDLFGGAWILSYPSQLLYFPVGFLQLVVLVQQYLLKLLYVLLEGSNFLVGMGMSMVGVGACSPLQYPHLFLQLSYILPVLFLTSPVIPRIVLLIQLLVLLLK